MSSEITEFIKERAHSREYLDFMTGLSQKLIDIDNTPEQPLSQIQANEAKAFEILEDVIKEFTDSQTSFERAPIDPSISEHPYYTNPYYTADKGHPNGLDVEKVYKDRFNLFAIVKPVERSSEGASLILNAHMDTVAPFFPSKVDDKYIHGRGSCDDKGMVVMLAASMKLMEDVRKKFGNIPAGERVYQYVIEEETGGNGSLSASKDARFKGHEVIVCEATNQMPHPANRGAMWFKLELETEKEKVNSLEIVPFVIVELAKEGQKLRDETNLKLFPKNYVQVNFGTLNSFGKHPSAINDYLSFDLEIQSEHAAEAEITSQLNEIINSALSQYFQSYPDRTKEIDEESNSPALAANYKLDAVEIASDSIRYKLEIFGLGGHMSALLLKDNALIKAGYILQSVINACKKVAGRHIRIFADEKDFSPAKQVITGGVGFSPAHRMVDLRSRMKEAVSRGIAGYNQSTGSHLGLSIFNMTFDMLHNEAYESPIDCPAMKGFEWAYRQMKMDWPTPVAFRASCDARIYGNNGQNTITFGPGDLRFAHSDRERLEISELQKGLELITLTTLRITTGKFG